MTWTGKVDSPVHVPPVQSFQLCWSSLILVAELIGRGEQTEKPPPSLPPSSSLQPSLALHCIATSPPQRPQPSPVQPCLLTSPGAALPFACLPRFPQWLQPGKAPQPPSRNHRSFLLSLGLETGGGAQGGKAGRQARRREGTGGGHVGPPLSIGPWGRRAQGARAKLLQLGGCL